MMGFIRKLTGADAARKQAEEMKLQTAAQEKALREESQRQATAAMTAAKANADMQKMSANRMAAEQKAGEAVGQPLGSADVALDALDEGGTADVKKRRAKFGRNYSSAGTGVSI